MSSSPLGVYKPLIIVIYACCHAEEVPVAFVYMGGGVSTVVFIIIVVVVVIATLVAVASVKKGRINTNRINYDALF